MIDKSYLYDDKMLEGLLRRLVSDGWFDDFAEPSFPEYEECEISDIPDSPEEVRRGLQKFKERLKRNGLLEAE